MRIIQRILNHKGVKNIKYTFRYAGKMNLDTARLIMEVVLECEIFKKNGRSRLIPEV